MAVFGDGRARLFALPRPNPSTTDPGAEPMVLRSTPLLETHVPAGTCLTTVRFSPHDPALLVAGASNGAAILYRIDAQAMLRVTAPPQGEEGDNNNNAPPPPPPPAVLLPVRRFLDARDNPRPQLSVVDSVAWHPFQRDVFVAVGCVGGRGGSFVRVGVV
jgi:hypothetical protein